MNCHPIPGTGLPWQSPQPVHHAAEELTYVAVYAHDKEEAVNLFTGSDSIEEETYEKEIVGNMVDEAFDKYKVVKEYKDRRTEEVCIAEFNVLM